MLRRSFSWTLARPVVAVLAVVACAESSPTGEVGNPSRTVVMINALEDGATIYVSGDVRDDSIPFGSARRLVDTRGTGFGPAPRGVIVGTRVGGSGSTSYMPAWGTNASAIVHGRSSTPKVASASDTLAPRPDVANIRLALTAEDAPLVRGFVLPASQELAGSLNWISTQSPYTAPLVTTFFRGTPQSYRVHFTRYAPGGSEPVLASTPPFTAAAGDVFTIIFAKSAGGYTATAVAEPR
jgi:hypothetical protein